MFVATAEPSARDLEVSRTPAPHFSKPLTSSFSCLAANMSSHPQQMPASCPSICLEPPSPTCLIHASRGLGQPQWNCPLLTPSPPGSPPSSCEVLLTLSLSSALLKSGCHVPSLQTTFLLLPLLPLVSPTRWDRLLHPWRHLLSCHWAGTPGGNGVPYPP